MVRSALVFVALSLSAAPVSAQDDMLQARLDAALATRDLRRAFFEATGNPPLSLEQAFPNLAGSPLNDPSFLEARRRTLRENRDACARERLEAGASDPSERVRATCDAEDAAVALEERLLSALSVGLERAPGFTASSIEPAREPWREAREHVSILAEDDPDYRAASRALVDAAEAERRLLLYQTTALRKMVLPGDSALGALVDAELSAPEELDADARDRLRRAAPLLSTEQVMAVEARLEGTSVEAESADSDESLEAPGDRESLEAERARHAAALAAVIAHDERYSRIEADFDDARTLTILDSGRAQRLRSVSHDAHALVQEIRSAIVALLRSREAYRAAPALAERDANIDEELTALMNLEKRALTLRRTVAPLGGEPITSQVFVDELVQELRDAPVWLELELREDARWLQTLPERTTDYDAIARLLELSFDLLLLVIVWIYVRNQSPRWLRAAVDASQKKDDSHYGFERPTRRVGKQELRRFARYASDAAGAFVLHRLLLPRSELLAMVALVWVGWALIRSVPAAIRWLLPLFGRALDPLEANATLPPEVSKLGERSANWFLWWWIVSNVASFIAVPLLQGDRLLQLVSAASWTIFFVLLVLTLGTWTPWIRQFIANLADQSAITVWLSRPRRSKIQRILRSALGAVYIVLRLVFWALVDRGWLSRSGTSIALSQLQLVDATTDRLSAEEREQIQTSEAPPIERDRELDVLQQAFSSWTRERRRGIVAVIGDHGMGKSVFLAQAEARLAEVAPDVPVRKLELPVRKRTDSLRERFAWLTDPLDIEIPKNANRAALQRAIVTHLEALPPHVLLVDDLHFLLRRTVGGFDVVELARNIIQACTDEHFWVLTLHRPAWNYVDGVSSAMKLAFRERIELEPIDAETLGRSLEDRTRAAGFEPEFQSLLKGRRPHADKDTLESKARGLYWRLVTQASLGNPRVIDAFWIESLGRTNGDGAKRVPVHLFVGHGDDEIDNLSDEYLFLLTALVVHDGLKLEDLADVLNLTVSRVRLACQNLESLGVIHDDRRRYLVSTEWQPAVARVLDRRNFAHR